MEKGEGKRRVEEREGVERDRGERSEIQVSSIDDQSMIQTRSSCQNNFLQVSSCVPIDYYKKRKLIPSPLPSSLLPSLPFSLLSALYLLLLGAKSLYSLMRPSLLPLLSISSLSNIQDTWALPRSNTITSPLLAVIIP
jgi:hypothetical protein